MDNKYDVFSKDNHTHRRKITVYDIASEAQVSPATVSRVLTGNAGVKEEKKNRILKIIEKYNFQPNALARSLFRKQSMMIGVIMPDITNPFFSTVFLEIEKWALQAGYTLFLCNSMNDRSIESKYLKILSEKQVDAIILVGGRINDSKPGHALVQEVNDIAEKIPVIMVNGKMKGVDGYIVRANEREGIFKLVEYLYGLGHRDFGLIGGSAGITPAEIKVRALKDALKNLNLEFHSEWVMHSGFSIDSGKESMEALISKKKLPTAVLAINDFVAVGAMIAAKQKGIKIPGDISITGFDDSYLTDIASPAITTVNQNYAGIGKCVMDIITGIADGKSVKKETIVETHLVVRDSCVQILAR